MPERYTINPEKVQEIHNQENVVNGRKKFGIFDSLISKKPILNRETIGQGKVDLSIVIPVMDRPDKFALSSKRLIESAKKAGVSTEIIVMDNSLVPIRSYVTETMPEQIDGPLKKIHYYWDPRIIQSTERNIAVGQFASGSIIGIWDCDIYASPGVIGEIMKSFTLRPDIDALSPILGNHQGADVEKSFEQYSGISQSNLSTFNLIRPGPFQIKNNPRENVLLKAAKLRSNFFVRTSILGSIAQGNPTFEPWLIDFVTWQNGPFFASLAELGKSAAYVINDNAISVHDNNGDGLSITNGMNINYYKNVQTLKSHILMMKRNQLYKQENKDLNKDYLNSILKTVKFAADFVGVKSDTIFKLMFDVAKIIDKTPTPEDFTKAVSEELTFENEKQKSIMLLIIGNLSHPEVFTRIKRLRSLDLTLPILELPRIKQLA